MTDTDGHGRLRVGGSWPARSSGGLLFSCGPPDRNANYLRPCGTICCYYHRDMDIGVLSQELHLSGADVTSPVPLSHPGDGAQVGWAAGRATAPPE